MQQRALIVRDNKEGAKELNEFLADGWRVVNTCAMPSSRAPKPTTYNATYTTFPTCLVIIERN
jgi:hypothetical protein